MGRWALGTQSLTAVGLVLPVFTVVFLVTGPAHGDAPPTGAGKVIERAPRTLHTWEQKGDVRMLRALGPPSTQLPPLTADLGSHARRCSLHSRWPHRTPSWVRSRGMSVRKAGRARLSRPGGNSCCSRWHLKEGERVAV